MIEKTPKKERLRGFAATISNAIQLAQKMNKERFDHMIEGKRTRVVYNPRDGKWAAVITLDKGNIEVQGIKNNPKEVLKRKNLLWWGYLETSIKNFMNATNTSSFKWFLKIITFKAKFRGIPHVRFIGDLIALATPPK